MREISDIKIKSVIKVFNYANAENTKKYSTNLPQHELIYYLSGRGLVVIDSTNIEIANEQITFLPKGKHETYLAKVFESGECIDIFFEASDSLFDEAHRFECKDNRLLRGLFFKLYQVWNAKQVGYYNKSMSLFYSILCEMEKISNRYVPQSKVERLQPAVDYIHQHYTEHKLSYELLPTLCNMGYTYFKKLFVNKFGMLPSEYVRDLRIRRACEILRTKKFTVTQVAEQCGFSDVYYFSKVFKQICGVSPSEWNGSLSNHKKG